MPINDDLGKRMKENYENRAKTYLIRRMPVAIRLDGKNFHTFSKGFMKPFDKILMESMQKTMKYLCENIQGCVFGYTQSDEITLILQDYKELNTAAWFDYEVQKICSISASMATMAFNRFFGKNANDYVGDRAWENEVKGPVSKDESNYCGTLLKAIEKGAMFDARCFNIPKEEVCNLIYWRQLDATRNSIQMVGQANFSHKELQNKSCNKIQDMLFLEKGINWNDFPIECKRGTACKRVLMQDERIDPKDGSYPVKKWIIDKEMPILIDKDRKYVEDEILFEDN